MGRQMHSHWLNDQPQILRKQINLPGRRRSSHAIVLISLQLSLTKTVRAIILVQYWKQNSVCQEKGTYALQLPEVCAALRCPALVEHSPQPSSGNVVA